MPRSRFAPLAADARRRAVLARQRLLVRAPGPVAGTVAALAGLQAQEPASPYLALHARLDGLVPEVVDAAIHAGDLVKATLMRSTLHLVTVDDYRHFRPAVAPFLHALSRQRREQQPEPHLWELVERTLAFAAVPRSNPELRDHVVPPATLPGDVAPDDAWWWVRRAAPLVNVPGRDPWAFGRRPMLRAATSHPGATPFAEPATATTHLVRRYLAAFGPATAADASAWSGLGVGAIRPAIAALDAEEALVRFSDEAGRELLDLADAPRPDGGTPAPPRLLPMWDNILLAHADRTWIVSDADRRRVVEINGDTYPTLLVDGRVAGLWWAEAEPGGRARVVLEPFERLSRAVVRSLEAEGERVAAFLAGREPDVYRRYRGSRARRLAGRG